MELKRIREDWEKGLTQMAVVTEDAGGYKTVYVVLTAEDAVQKYYLHRYFLLNNNWTASVDVDTTDLKEALDALTEAFKPSYPKGLESLATATREKPPAVPDQIELDDDAGKTPRILTGNQLRFAIKNNLKVRFIWRPNTEFLKHGDLPPFEDVTDTIKLIGDDGWASIGSHSGIHLNDFKEDDVLVQKKTKEGKWAMYAVEDVSYS